MSTYNYKGTPLSSIFATGTADENINIYYQGFPPVTTTTNSNIGTVNFIPYYINGDNITSIHNITAVSKTYTSSNVSGNFSITVPSWANSIKSTLISQNGSPGTPGSAGTIKTANVINGFNCPRNSNNESPYGNIHINKTAYNAAGGAGGAGGNGGLAGKVSIVKPYVFNPSTSTLKGTINPNYVSIQDNNKQIILLTPGEDGGVGGSGSNGIVDVNLKSKGNNSGTFTCYFTIPGDNQAKASVKTPGTYYTIQNEYSVQKSTGANGGPGTNGKGGAYTSNLSTNMIEASNISSNTSSIKVYFFNN